MGGLVHYSVRIDVSRLIDPSQPFREARLAAVLEPPDFHVTQGVDNNPGRLQRRSSRPNCGILPSAEGSMAEPNGRRNAADWWDIPLLARKGTVFRRVPS